jgi:CDP-glucose 4,6-dehydratase
MEIKKSTLENMDMMNLNFWRNKNVLITGHTGFKGSWLTLMLNQLGANVTGYALEPEKLSLFNQCEINSLIQSNIGDIRDGELLKKVMQKSKPEIVIHMAAQPLVRESYINPVETYSVNVMGTVNVLECIRQTPGVRAVVNVTTDKCYENREWVWGYRETEALGGYDPYSSSKACSELVTSAYRNSFFNEGVYETHGVALATARAGNVIGGGDWSKDRLIPDCVRAILNQETILIRNPDSIRPWQHVLEPLCGYLILAERLFERGTSYAEPWNFGPYEVDAKPVRWIVERLCNQWGNGANYNIVGGDHPHEATYLKLDCSKSVNGLGWDPQWNLADAIDKIIEWTLAYKNGQDIKAICYNQIAEYIK